MRICTEITLAPLRRQRPHIKPKMTYGLKGSTLMNRYVSSALVLSVSSTLSLLVWSHSVEAASSKYKTEIETFHAKRDTSLRTNWLTITGLDWLKGGENTIGSAKDNNIHLPSTAPATLGVIKLSGTKPATASFEFTDTKDVTLDGKAVELGKFYSLKTDATAAPSIIAMGTVSFFIVERPNGLGVRAKDTANPAIEAFKGIRWWPINENLRITAKWVKLPEPKIMKFQDVLGNQNQTETHGYAEFKLDGHDVKIYPTEEGQPGTDNSYEFIFRDHTSGKESYGAARYLNTSAPNKNGEIVLDFNKAYNPPCAYTAYATCPLPPPENVLKVGIHAGELKPLHHPNATH